MPTKEKTRLEAIFHGYVQGVGFRFTTLRLARNYPAITGYVRNVPDGTVELVAEGPRQDVQNLLEDAKRHMETHIRSVDVKWVPFENEFSHFDIGF